MNIKAIAVWCLFLAPASAHSSINPSAMTERTAWSSEFDAQTSVFGHFFDRIDRLQKRRQTLRESGVSCTSDSLIQIHAELRSTYLELLSFCQGVGVGRYCFGLLVEQVFLFPLTLDMSDLPEAC